MDYWRGVGNIIAAIRQTAFYFSDLRARRPIVLQKAIGLISLRALGLEVILHRIPGLIVGRLFNQ